MGELDVKHEISVLDNEKRLRYWTQQLEEIQPLRLLNDFESPPTNESRSLGVQRLLLGDSTSQTLRSYSRSNGTSPFILLLAAFRAAHFRLTGHEDATLVAGDLSSNPDGLQVIRLQTQEVTFAQIVQQVQDALERAREHQLPLDQVLRRLRNQPRRRNGHHGLGKIDGCTSMHNSRLGDTLPSPVI